MDQKNRQLSLGAVGVLGAAIMLLLWGDLRFVDTFEELTSTSPDEARIDRTERGVFAGIEFETDADWGTTTTTRDPADPAGLIDALADRSDGLLSHNTLPGGHVIGGTSTGEPEESVTVAVTVRNTSERLFATRSVDARLQTRSGEMTDPLGGGVCSRRPDVPPGGAATVVWCFPATDANGLLGVIEGWRRTSTLVLGVASGQEIRLAVG